MSQVTPSNFQAWTNYFVGCLADKTTQLNEALCTERVKLYIKDHLETLMFVAPLLFIKMAPLSFSVTLIAGFLGGVFSKDNMDRIVADKNKILAGGVPSKQPEVNNLSLDTTEQTGGEQNKIRARGVSSGQEEIHNTSFKVTLIFVCVILHHFFPFPSLQMFYAAACGLHLGVSLAFYVPEWVATSWAEKIDKRLPFLPQFKPDTQ